MEWHKVPTASQHFNGCAEAMIKVTKTQLSDMMKNRNFTKGELDTLFSDVQFLVNTRPLMMKAGSDPLSGGPITPLHLMLGRSTIQVPIMKFDKKASITKRVEFLETIKQEFWDKWFVQVFHHLLPCYKWKTESRNVQEGDIVLMKAESALSQSYKLARVEKVVVDPDGMVRRVFLHYTNVDGKKEYKRGGYKVKQTERAVHGLVVIKPADWEEEKLENTTMDDPAL